MKSSFSIYKLKNGPDLCLHPQKTEHEDDEVIDKIK